MAGCRSVSADVAACAGAGKEPGAVAQHRPGDEGPGVRACEARAGLLARGRDRALRAGVRPGAGAPVSARARAARTNARRRAPPRRRSGCGCPRRRGGSRGPGSAASRWSDRGRGVRRPRGCAPASSHRGAGGPRGPVLVAHRLAADAVQPVEAVEAEAPEHGVDGRAGDTERPGDPVRPVAGTVADGADDRAPAPRGCAADGGGAPSCGPRGPALPACRIT